MFTKIKKNKKYLQWHGESGAGFTIIEVLVSVGIISMMLVLFSSFFTQMYALNAKTTAYREVSENAKKVMEIIAYEIKGAESVYTPTTSASQLSLETYRYLPGGEDISFIDFFVCGAALCLKKESQAPIPLTSDTVEVESVAFSQVITGGFPSITIDLTLANKNPNNNPNENYETQLVSTVSLRKY